MNLLMRIAQFFFGSKVRSLEVDFHKTRTSTKFRLWFKSSDEQKFLDNSD